MKEFGIEFLKIFISGFCFAWYHYLVGDSDGSEMSFMEFVYLLAKISLFAIVLVSIKLSLS